MKAFLLLFLASVALSFVLAYSFIPFINSMVWVIENFLARPYNYMCDLVGREVCFFFIWFFIVFMFVGSMILLSYNSEGV